MMKNDYRRLFDIKMFNLPYTRLQSRHYLFCIIVVKYKANILYRGSALFTSGNKYSVLYLCCGLHYCNVDNYTH